MVVDIDLHDGRGECLHTVSDIEERLGTLERELADEASADMEIDEMFGRLERDNAALREVAQHYLNLCKMGLIGIVCNAQVWPSALPLFEDLEEKARKVLEGK